MSRVKNARDPQRRQRIIEACLDSIVDVGVAGTSHRKIAARAEVPLGSMTYHFNGMDELLYEAFEQFAAEAVIEFERVMAGAESSAEFRQRYIAYICDIILGQQRNVVLTLELYTLAARSPEHRALTQQWLRGMKRILTRFVDADTAVLLDALIAGFSLHRVLGSEKQADELVSRAFDAIVGRR